MAEAGSYESILRHGLLSTSALLDRFEIDEGRRFGIESCHRSESVEIDHPEFGTARVRDQKPMPPDILQQCLTGNITPRDWYELLNRKVFLWVGEDRVKRFGRVYPDSRLITLDTRSLLERHRDRVWISNINSGAPFRMKPSPRGLETFRPLREFPLPKPVVELTVDYAVPDIRDFLS